MKFRYLFFLLPVLLFGCKKKHNNTTDPNGNSGVFSYAPKYDSIVSSPANSMYNFSFTIKVLSGKIAENKLTCSIEGLPAEVVVTPDSLVVGQLLGGVFSFNVGNLPIGYYPFLLKIRSQKYGLQVYHLSLHIVPLPDYAPLLAGTYDSCYDYCGGIDFVHYASQVTTVVDTPFLIKLNNIQNFGSSFVVRARVSKTVTVPVQTVGGKTIWGSGTYTRDARPGHEDYFIMTIKDTLVSGVDTQICTMHIEH